VRAGSSDARRLKMLIDETARGAHVVVGLVCHAGCALLAEGMTSPRSAHDTPVPHIAFTSHLQQHIDCKQQWFDGSSVRLVLEQVLSSNPRWRGCLCDDQGRLRKHVTVFVDGRMIRDRDCRPIRWLHPRKSS
jgi:hypothetical protein